MFSASEVERKIKEEKYFKGKRNPAENQFIKLEISNFIIFAIAIAYQD
jgi:hypothetical protein